MDKSYSGFASAVKTPSDFCVSLEDLLLVTNKVSVELDDLPSQLIPLPEDHIAPGTCCLLNSDSRNKWCRAEIVHVNTTVVLNLVDCGHYECMPYDDCSNLKKTSRQDNNPPKGHLLCITSDTFRFLEQSSFRAHSQILVSEEQCGPEEEGSCEA